MVETPRSVSPSWSVYHPRHAGDAEAPERFGAVRIAVRVAQRNYFVLNGATEMQRDGIMKSVSARIAENVFSLMIDTARAEPVLTRQHGRSVVWVVSLGPYETPPAQSGRADDGETETKGAPKYGQ